MTHSNNLEYMHPEIIALCTNCKRPSCNYGKCDAVFEKIGELKKRRRQECQLEKNRRLPGPHAAVYTHNGETHSLTEWAEILGIRKGILYARRRRGEPQEQWFRPYQKGESHAK